MKSDLQKLLEVFETLGIFHIIVKEQGNNYDTSVEINEGSGNFGFYGIFYFLDEKFINYGLWE